MKSSALIKFPELTFTEPGVYSYTIKELSPSRGGWSNDNKIYRLIITVIEDKFGKLITIVKYPDGKPIFTNIFTYVPITIDLTAKEITSGSCDRPFAAFCFGLFNEKFQTVSITNSINGWIRFPKLQFNKPGIYTYWIKELSKPGCGRITDNAVYQVIITIKENENGILIADVVYPKGMAIFINRYIL